jgi:UDP-N-acetylglucosamine 2-epimerase
MVFELKMKKRPEAADAGTVKLVGTNVQHIVIINFMKKLA